MEHTPAGIIEFRLSPADLRVTVDVRLRRAQERWVATATIRGERQTGMGSNPRQALRAALAKLDARAIAALLADTALLEPSVTIAAVTTG